MQIQNTSFYLSASVFTIFVNFLTLPIFTRFLGPEDYGIIGMFILFGNILVAILSIGFRTALYGLYFKLKKEEFRIINTSSFLFLIILFSSFFYLILEQSGNYIADKVFNNTLTPEILYLGYLNGCINYFYQYFLQIFVAQKRARLFFIITVMQITLNASITFYFLYFLSYSFMGALYGLLFANIIVFLISFFIHRRLFILLLRLDYFLRLVKFGFPLIFNTIIDSFYAIFDKTMLLNYRGLMDVGHYDFANRFNIILKSFIDAFGKSFSPDFIEVISSGKRESEKITNSFFQIFFIISFFGLFIAYFSEEALIVLTTPDFYIVKLIVPLVILYYLFSVMGLLSINQFIASENMQPMAYISFLTALINIILNIILIPRIGVYGAAISTSLAAFISNIMLLYYSHKTVGFKIDYRKITIQYLNIFVFLLLGFLVISLNLNIYIKIPIKLFLIGFFVISSSFYLKISLRSILLLVKSRYKFE